MPDKIREYCRRINQKIPEDKPAIVRCIRESLELKYRMTINSIEQVVGYELPVIHIVGGGSRNVLLDQFTANATGKPFNFYRWEEAYQTFEEILQKGRKMENE